MAQDNEKIIYRLLYDDRDAEMNISFSNLLLENNFKKLKRKPFKGIKSHLNDSINIFNVYNAGFLNPDYDFEKLDGIGRTIAAKCTRFYSELSDSIIYFSKMNDEKQQQLYNLEIIYKEYGIRLDEHEYLLSGNNFFSFLAFVLRNPIFFSERDTMIYNEMLWIFDRDHSGKRKTNEEIGSNYGLTAERVRQLGQDFFKKFEQRIKILDELNLRIYIPNLFDSEKIVHFTREKIMACKDKGARDFDGGFIAYVLSFYMDGYTLVGNYKNYILDLNFSNVHRWKYLYLVRKEIAEYVDFNKIFEHLHNLLNDRITETYEIKVEDLFEKYKKVPRITAKLHTRIVKVLDYLLDAEFGISVNKNGAITIARNTYLLIWEHTLKALEAIDRPAFIEEIIAKLEEMYPDKEFNLSSVRSSMITRDEFIHIGRQSKYGLTKWEDSKKDFKGGTIRDIVEEYLRDHDGLQHIDDISEYVLKYRPTTSKDNIYSNLLLERNKRFVIPKPGFIGLGNGVKDS